MPAPIERRALRTVERGILLELEGPRGNPATLTQIKEAMNRTRGYVALSPLSLEEVRVEVQSLERDGAVMLVSGGFILTHDGAALVNALRK